MKITIEIDDKDFQKQVEEALIRRTVDALEREMYNGQRRLTHNYHDDIKASMREILKKNLDDLSERAVTAAATTITNKAMKQYADRITEAITNG